MTEQKKILAPVDFKKVIRNQKNKTVRNLPNFIINIIRRILKEKQLNKFIEANGDKYNIDFIKGAHKYFNVDVKHFYASSLDPNGRYIFVVNHSIGGFDFSAVMKVLDERFPKIRVIANKVLTDLDNIKELLLPVGVFEKTNHEAKQRIERIMSSDDHQILTFPAGKVARKIKGKIQDPPWHRSFVRQAIKYKREVVPIYVDSFNSNFFYNVARLRTFLGIKANIELFFLVGEQFKKKNSTIPIYIGKPIHYSHFSDEKTHLEWAKEVQEITWNLKKNETW